VSISVGDIIASFKWDTSSLDKGTRDAQTQLAKIGTASVAAGNMIADMATEAFNGFMKLAQAPIAAAVAAGKYAESIDNMSHATGISADNLQSYQVILNRTGLELSDLQTSFRTLANKMQEAAKPGSEAAQSFEKLGLVLTGKESPTEMLNLISDKLATMPDGFEKTAMATDLLGRSGMKLIPVLGQGSAAFDKAAESARLMGVIMSGEARERAMKLDDSIDDLKLSQQAFANTVGSILAPAMTVVVNWLTEGINKVTAFIQRFDEAASKSGSWATGLANALIGTTVGPDDKKPIIIPRGSTPMGPSKEDLEAMKKGATLSEHQIALMLQEANLTDYIYSAKRLQEIMPELGLLQAAELARKNEMYGQKQLIKDIGAQRAIEAQKNNQVYQGEYARTQQIKDFKESQLQYGNQLETQLESESKGYLDIETVLKRVDDLSYQLIGTGMTQDQMQDALNEEYEIGLATMFQQREELEFQKNAPKEIAKGVAELNLATAQRASHLREVNLQMDIEEEKWASKAALQTATYQQESMYMGAAEAARAASLRSFEETEERKKFMIEQSYLDGITSADQYQTQLDSLEARGMAQRMAIVAQYPTFWEQQLQAVVQSNVFSMSQIMNSATGAMAAWVVQGTSFKQFWTQLQTSMVQASLQFGVQAIAQYALQSSRELGLAQLLAMAKVALFGETATAAVAEQQLVAKSGIAAAGSTLAAIGSVGEASLGVLAAVTEAVVGFFEAMAAALAATVVGAPMAPEFALAGEMAQFAGGAAIVAGQGVLTGAMTAAGGALTSALAVPAMAEGGIINEPTLIYAGEAGPEKITPLDEDNSGGMQTIIIELDSRVLAEAVMKATPSRYRLKMGNR